MKRKWLWVVSALAGCLIAFAGSAVAVNLIGGAITGSVSDNGAQPQLVWATSEVVPSYYNNTPNIESEGPTLSGCVDAEGNQDSTASGSGSVSADGNTLTLSLANVYAGETCTFSVPVQNDGPYAIQLTGVNSTGTAPLTLVGTPPSVPPPSTEQTGSTWVQVEGQVTLSLSVVVPADAGTYTISGQLETSFGGN